MEVAAFRYEKSLEQKPTYWRLWHLWGGGSFDPLYLGPAREENTHAEIPC